jgi:hypothetical protein
MRRLARRDDRGATAVITAIFLVALLLPVCLITIDVGRVYAERRQLQNGADAGALAVAQSCASEGGCDTSFADTYADPNSNDLTQHVLEVCGTADGLPACGAPSGGELSNCTPIAADSPYADTPYVQVRTRVDGPEGLVLLPLFGADAVTVSACARAALGGVRTATGLAFTASYCEWANATGDGSNFGSDHRVSLALKAPGPNEPALCSNGPGSGWGDAPGSFGWLDSNGNCTATVDTDATYSGDTGANFPQECQQVMYDLVASGDPVFIPIFDAVQGTGTSVVYRFKGWAAFVLTGYDLNGGKTGDGCISPTSRPCITGYFTEALLTDPDAVIGGDWQYGAHLIGLTG